MRPSDSRLCGPAFRGLDSKPGQRISRKQRSATDNAMKLLGVTDGIPTWRHDVPRPPTLAKNAT
jgi:hypothetical protein